MACYLNGASRRVWGTGLSIYKHSHSSSPLKPKTSKPPSSSQKAAIVKVTVIMLRVSEDFICSILLLLRPFLLSTKRMNDQIVLVYQKRKQFKVTRRSAARDMNSESVITHAVDCSDSRLCGEESVIQRWLNSWDSRRIHVKEISENRKLTSFHVIWSYLPILWALPPHKHVMFPTTTQIDLACATHANALSSRSTGFFWAQQLEQFDSSNYLPPSP